MSVVCPRGHESQATDYCDQCGALMVVEEVDTSPAARREPCPVCGAPRSGDDRYCEGCGYDFLDPPPAPSTWEAIVTADRAQFERLAVAGVSFPADYAERRFALADGREPDRAFSRTERARARDRPGGGADRPGGVAPARDARAARRRGNRRA